MKIRFVAALALLIATTTFAQPRAARLARYLDLTPDQVTAWKQIHTDAAATIQPLAAAQRETRQQLEAALKAPSPDPAAVGKLTIVLHATRAQIRAARAAEREKFAAVLTPEQKAKLDDLKKLRGR